MKKNNLRNHIIREIGDSDNGGLPKGWKLVKLGEVCDRITKGGTPTTYGFAFVHKGINFIKVENIEQGKVNLHSIKNFISVEAHKNQKKSQLEENDLLFSIAGTIGETCLVKKEYLPANTNQALAILRGYDKHLYPKFLTFQLSSSIAQIVKTKARGGAMNNISLEDLKRIEVVVPPISEQNRIVAKLEELLSELEKGKEQLHTALAQLKVYRQAVLKYAFEGKLTRQNRGLNGFKDDTEKSKSRIKQIKGLTQKNENNNLRNPVISEIGDSDNELPEGWKWVKIKEIGRIETGTTPSKNNPAFYGTDYPFYKPTDLNAGNNVYKSVDGLSELGIKEARVVPEASILVTCIGATIGKTGFIKNGGGFNQQINAIVPSKEYVPKYIYYQAICSHFQKQITDNASATTLPILNKGKFEILEMVICPLEVQHHIVQEIESRLSVADKLEETITTSIQQSETLRQSILKKAFEGRLV